jgi:carbon monoxide dehydrogenase subunit G
MQLSSSIKIDRKIEDVFAFMTKVENMARWVSGVSGARLLSPRMEKGARFVADYTSSFRKNAVEFVVSEFEAPELLGLEVARGPFSFRGRIKLRQTDGGTVVTNEIQADPDSLSTRLASVVLGPMLRGTMTERLQRELMALDQAIGQTSPA